MAEKAKKEMNPAVMQAVKAIAVLVIICLVCVLLLALCNDLLYIDDNTRLARAMKKVFEDFELDHEEAVKSVEISTGKINKVYVSKDGTYIIEALGTDGYQGGTVTLYVVVDAQGVIKGWSVKENDKQSYIDRMPSNAGKTWYVGKMVSDDIQLDMTGATIQFTAKAIYNAILSACAYANSPDGLGLGGVSPVEAAKNAVLELLGEEFGSYNLTRVNLGDATMDGTNKAVDALSDDDNALEFLFAGTGDKGTVFAYVYGEGETIKIVAVTQTEVLKNANVTGEEEFYANILANPMYTFTYGGKQAYAMITNVDAATKVYTVAGLKFNTIPDTYALTITIEDDGGHGKVASIALASEAGNGYVSGPGAPSEAEANVLIEKLVGATAETIESLYGNKATGATESANLIRAAVEAALKHYDASLASND